MLEHFVHLEAAKGGDAAAYRKLKQLFAPFVLRRKKSDVLSQIMPPKTRKVAGEPLRPFEQLLGCLPPSSSYLLPEPYRWLMTSSDSPLIE